MNLGFSMGASPIQTQITSPQHSNQMLQMRPDQLLARTALIAMQLGASTSFFSQVTLARIVIRAPSKNEETRDQKKAKDLIRKIKTEKTEPSNDQRPQ